MDIALHLNILSVVRIVVVDIFKRLNVLPSEMLALDGYIYTEVGVRRVYSYTEASARRVYLDGYIVAIGNKERKLCTGFATKQLIENSLTKALLSL